jgi:hypothetical protein
MAASNLADARAGLSALIDRRSRGYDRYQQARQSWLACTDLAEFLISDSVITAMSTALAITRRTVQIDLRQPAAAMAK